MSLSLPFPFCFPFPFLFPFPFPLPFPLPLLFPRPLPFPMPRLWRSRWYNANADSSHWTAPPQPPLPLYFYNPKRGEVSCGVLRPIILRVFVAGTLSCNFLLLGLPVLRPIFLRVFVAGTLSCSFHVCPAPHYSAGFIEHRAHAPGVKVNRILTGQMLSYCSLTLRLLGISMLLLRSVS